MFTNPPLKNDTFGSPYVTPPKHPAQATRPNDPYVTTIAGGNKEKAVETPMTLDKMMVELKAQGDKIKDLQAKTNAQRDVIQSQGDSIIALGSHIKFLQTHLNKQGDRINAQGNRLDDICKELQHLAANLEVNNDNKVEQLFNGPVTSKKSKFRGAQKLRQGGNIV